jgi:signal transduction histidine kinase
MTEAKKIHLELMRNAGGFHGNYLLAKYWLSQCISIQEILETANYLNIDCKNFHFEKEERSTVTPDLFHMDLLLKHIEQHNFKIEAERHLKTLDEGNSTSSRIIRAKEPVQEEQNGVRDRAHYCKLLGEFGFAKYTFYYSMYLLDRVQSEDDLNIVYKLIKKAANQELAEAMFVLGLFLIKGSGVTQNEEVGLTLLKKAADEHLYEATFTLMELYGDKFSDEYYIDKLENLKDWWREIDTDMLMNLHTGWFNHSGDFNFSPDVNEVIGTLNPLIFRDPQCRMGYVNEHLITLYKKQGELETALECAVDCFVTFISGGYLDDADKLIEEIVELKLRLGQTIDRPYLSKLDNFYAIVSNTRKNDDELPLSNDTLDKFFIKSQELLLQQKNELEKKNNKLMKKEQELEEMMAMFAHKFRSPLDAILYNTSHGNNAEIYERHAQTMRGLLDIFSMISTDQDVLVNKLTKDITGDGTLQNLLVKIIDMILLHLLTESGSDKIHQHFFSYAIKNKTVPHTTDAAEWYNEYFELEEELRAAWQQEYAQLVENSDSLEERLKWIERYFFKLEISGFDNSIRFKEYGITESFLVIVINEILTNLFKYYSSTMGKSAQLSWQAKDGYQSIICSNPSVKSERLEDKGSYKGHKFLSAIARKTGSVFDKPEIQDNFSLEFSIPDNILIKEEVR